MDSLTTLASENVHVASISNTRKMKVKRYFRNPQLVIGSIIVLLLVLIGTLAPWIIPYPYDQVNYEHTWEKESSTYLFGTDQLGRDLFSRVIYGTRISLTVAFGATTITILLGTLVGAIAGYFGGKVDLILMRVVDIVLAFPSLLFIILLSVVLGSGVGSIILAIGLTRWSRLSRMVRGEFLKFRETEFVTATRALGASDLRIILNHILPNSMAPIIVFVSFDVPFAIVSEAGLSFIGIGVNPPLPSWGVLLNYGFNSFRSFPNMVIYPSLFLAVAMFGFVLLGDGLRTHADPTMGNK